MQLIKVSDTIYVNADNVYSLRLEADEEVTKRVTKPYWRISIGAHRTMKFYDKAEAMQVLTRMIQELASGKAIVSVTGD